MTTRGLLLLCLTVAGCADGVCGAPRQDAQVTLLRMGGLEVLPVTINGEPAGLGVDTGAFLTSVTPQAVAALKLFTSTGPMRITGVGGESYVRTAEINDLRIGGGQVSGATVLVSPMWKADLDEYPVFGLLGDELLVNWDLDLDAGHDRLDLYEPASCAASYPVWTKEAQEIGIPRTATGAALGASDVEKGFQASSLYAPTHTGDILFTVTLDGHQLTAKLDTGAARSVVRADAVGLTAADVATDPKVTLMGMGRLSIQGVRHHFTTLRVGGTDVHAPAIDVGDIQLNDADMLLGEDFLRRNHVYVAFHAGELFVMPNPPSGGAG